MARELRNIGASVRARLLARARVEQTDFQILLTRYALERLLYRLSVSDQRERFVLKGAMLFAIWQGDPFRPTRDLDLLGHGDPDPAIVAASIRSICSVEVPDDGVVFDVAGLEAAPIRGEDEYPGVRVRTGATIAGARLPIQIDVGFGDVITPEAIEIEYPALLDAPAPILRAYPPETVVAEKTEAIVSLGIANSRMKDFYDLWTIAQAFAFEGDDLAEAMRIVEPVIVRPLLAAWETEKEQIVTAIAKEDKARPVRRRRRTGSVRIRASQGLLNAFLKRLQDFTVLDPACGSGNFLYLALHALKDIEHRVNFEAEAMGLERSFPAIGPANVKGIEINAYAAELARVSVWIGDIQWMRRNGFNESRDPILKPLETIECRDAILAPDGTEPDWPEANVVIGNPPFLGDRVMRGGLGHEYTERLRQTYKGSVPGSADLVCYWFAKAGVLVANGSIARAGLVATNSIRGGNNRPVLDRIVADCAIFDAWSDEPWVIDGAAVRVSLVCFGPRDAGLPISLNSGPTAHIRADLTEDGIDLTRVARLDRNRAVAFLGVYKNGPFDIPGDLARDWLRLPANPNGRPNSDVLKPRVNGMDLTRRPAGKWIIDFGEDLGETDAALYEAPFAHVVEHVKPVRLGRRRERHRRYWWRHGETRPGMWRALGGLPRFIATPTVSKHRLFAWLDAGVCPDHQLIVIARDDDVTFGILHSRFHEAWSLRLGTWLGKGNDPRYTPTTTFETFPFPVGLSPDLPAADYAGDPRAIAIGEAARRLVELRDRWLNPPEWVEWVDEPVPGYPKRPVARNETAAKELKARTLTNLYNAHPQWLADAHASLNAAVAAAYGWDAGISEDEALRNLLALNEAVGK